MSSRSPPANPCGSASPTTPAPPAACLPRARRQLAQPRVVAGDQPRPADRGLPSRLVRLPALPRRRPPARSHDGRPRAPGAGRVRRAGPRHRRRARPDRPAQPDLAVVAGRAPRPDESRRRPGRRAPPDDHRGHRDRQPAGRPAGKRAARGVASGQRRGAGPGDQPGQPGRTNRQGYGVPPGPQPSDEPGGRGDQIGGWPAGPASDAAQEFRAGTGSAPRGYASAGPRDGGQTDRMGAVPTVSPTPPATGRFGAAPQPSTDDAFTPPVIAPVSPSHPPAPQSTPPPAQPQHAPPPPHTAHASVPPPSGPRAPAGTHPPAGPRPPTGPYPPAGPPSAGPPAAAGASVAPIAPRAGPPQRYDAPPSTNGATEAPTEAPPTASSAPVAVPRAAGRGPVRAAAR